jgi:2-iminobutanoate/2-iminopropanoate deaminase
MPKTVVSTPLAPAAIGPYSQAIRAGQFLFVSGQIPIDPATGQLIADRSIRAQTRQVLANLQGVLAASGLSLRDVVKVTIYLDDLGDFKKVNKTYGEFFQSTPPARATVEVAGLPLGAGIEIDCVAFLDL